MTQLNLASFEVRVLRDRLHPTRLLPDYASGDHVHPNDAGYAAMAEAVDLSLFRDNEDCSLPVADAKRSPRD